MPLSFVPDMDPNPFFNGPAVHSHQNCSYCHKFQRCEFEKLRACAACGNAVYCSKECQRSHWPQHKIDCNTAKAQDKHIKEHTGIEHGYTDLLRWIEYYSTPMKNCMIAALNLPNYPHQERDSVLTIQITHKRDATLPVEHRFIIDSIARNNRNDNGHNSKHIIQMLDSEDIKKAVEFGKLEMGKFYYGTAMIMIFAFFSETPYIVIPIKKVFAIQKPTAQMKVTQTPWWIPLRNIMENGKKMRFCCGKLEGGGCCCGGWVHSEDVKKGNVFA